MEHEHLEGRLTGLAVVLSQDADLEERRRVPIVFHILQRALPTQQTVQHDR